MDNAYAEDGYKRDMEPDAIYGQGPKAFDAERNRAVMTREMYYAGGACLPNEELAKRIKDGGNDVAALLLSQNEGFLSSEAAKLCGQYSRPSIMDDLKEEGALAPSPPPKHIIRPAGQSC